MLPFRKTHQAVFPVPLPLADVTLQRGLPGRKILQNNASAGNFVVIDHHEASGSFVRRDRIECDRSNGFEDAFADITAVELLFGTAEYQI